MVRTTSSPGNFGTGSGTFYVRIEPGATPATGSWGFAFDSYDS